MAYLPPDQIPSGTSPATRAAIIDMIRSSSQIVSVAGETERNQVLAAWEEATGAPVGPLNPCWVDRADTGALERNRGNQWEIVTGFPWRERADVMTLPNSGATTANASANFPAGLFTVTPNVTLGVEQGTGLVIATFQVSTNALTIWVRRVDGNPISASYKVHWHAKQMTPTSAAG